MNWLTDYVRPKLRALVKKDIPDNLWQKCRQCDAMIFHRDFEANLNVCPHCGNHMRLEVIKRLEMLFDAGQFHQIPLPKTILDPLKFKDQKRYTERLKDAQDKTGRQDAIVIAQGKIDDMPVIIAAFDFNFMGGSMGSAVGEALVTAAKQAVSQSCPLITIPASGGARMQEGVLSLMQLPRSVVAIEKVRDAGLPYIVILTDPTTGGVSASFAMLGDIHIAEPKAMIGFAGARVIEQTIRQKLPEDFQTAEYLMDHGMVDLVVERKYLKQTLARILNVLMHKRKYAQPSAAS